MSENPFEPPKAPLDNGLGMALLRLRLEIILVLLLIGAVIGGLAILF